MKNSFKRITLLNFIFGIFYTAKAPNIPNLPKREPTVPSLTNASACVVPSIYLGDVTAIRQLPPHEIAALKQFIQQDQESRRNWARPLAVRSRFFLYNKDLLGQINSNSEASLSQKFSLLERKEIAKLFLGTEDKASELYEVTAGIKFFNPVTFFNAVPRLEFFEFNCGSCTKIESLYDYIFVDSAGYLYDLSSMVDVLMNPAFVNKLEVARSLFGYYVASNDSNEPKHILCSLIKIMKPGDAQQLVKENFQQMVSLCDSSFRNGEQKMGAMLGAFLNSDLAKFFVMRDKENSLVMLSILKQFTEKISTAMAGQSKVNFSYEEDFQFKKLAKLVATLVQLIRLANFDSPVLQQLRAEGPMFAQLEAICNAECEWFEVKVTDVKPEVATATVEESVGRKQNSELLKQNARIQLLEKGLAAEEQKNEEQNLKIKEQDLKIKRLEDQVKFISEQFAQLIKNPKTRAA